MVTAAVRSKAMILLSLIHKSLLLELCVSWCYIFVSLCSCILSFLSSDRRRCLLDFGCTIAVFNVFVVLFCLDLKTA